MTYIAMLSGGKDSTAMIDLLLRNGYPLDHIIFCDTLNEYDAMYEYIAKLSEYFKAKYDKEVITLKPKLKFSEFITGIISSGEHMGSARGIPQISVPCGWRRETKVRPFEKWLKRENITEYKIYIGFTVDETHRRSSDEKFLYPLIDDFKMSESECAAYLKDREMQNPLYKHFTRTGCFFCPYASQRAFYQTWKHYPKEWAKIKAYESRLLSAGKNILNPSFFKDYKSCDEMEEIFRQSDKQGSFVFDDEPLRDYFCKI